MRRQKSSRLAQARIQQTEAWKALEEERRLREASALSEKAAFEAALEQEKALEGELKIARGALSRTEDDLNEARARIRSAVADYKNSPASIIMSR